MDDLLIQKAQPEDFLAIARLIAEQNKPPERHCIHSDSGEEGEQAIYQEMLRLDATAELCFVVARQAGQIVGALGSEVDEEAGRLNRLVTDLLRFARPVSVKRSPVSLVELANRCRSGVGDAFEIRVELASDPGVQVVDADPNLFRLVFDNLVSNACQSMGERGIVEIRIDRAELLGQEAARIEISDKGHGMEPQVLERALDPFFTTRPSGTGLGLPIVHRIIEAHGGELLIDSLEGEGTRVVIIVPVHAPPEAVAAAAEQRSLVSLALGWLLHHSPADGIILGASKQEQLDENLRAVGDGPLSHAALEQCEQAWALVRGVQPKYNR